MKTKNIFKTLAFAMLMPAMLLTTACSSDNDVITNNENINKKGYEIPVTLNATRQGDDATTRATYNPDTKKLEYSTGDQLFVYGNHPEAGKYGGALEWKGGIIFSGTITTTNPYSGTGVELLSSAKSARAQLLPAGYNNYHYITINDNPGITLGTGATFATSKATAIEQFSNESVKGYNNGFALAPQNAILNFTITGLTPNTEFAVELWNSYYSLVEGNVTTNGSGTATFAIGIFILMCTEEDIADLYNKGWDLRMKDNNNDYVLIMSDDNNPLVTSSKPLVAGHIYNITRSATPAVPEGAISGKFSVSSTKKVNFSKGNLQATYNGTDWTWAFAANQWDYIGNAEGNTKVSASTPFVSGYSGSSTTVDLFGWVGASSTWMDVAQYGITSSSATNNTNGYGNNASEALKSDWGNTIGSGWRTLTSDEWQWMLGPSSSPTPGTNCRTSSTIGGVANARWVKAVVHSTKGLIIYPDALTWNDATMGTAPTTSNTANNDFTYNTLTDAQWSALEAAGCVFLPAAGFRSQATVAQAGSRGGYWSSSPNSESYAYRVYFISGNLNPAFGSNRYGGNSVRLVREVPADSQGTEANDRSYGNQNDLGTW